MPGIDFYGKHNYYYAISLRLSGELDQTSEKMMKTMREIPNVYRKAANPNMRMMSIHFDSNFSFPDERVKEALCTWMDKFQCDSLCLEDMNDPSLDPMVKDVIINLSGKCHSLSLYAKFSDEAILTIHDFLEQNGGVQWLKLVDVDMSEFQAALFGKTKLSGERVTFGSYQSVKILEDKRLTRIVENLANFKVVKFLGSSIGSLRNKRNAWKAFGRALSSPQCNISKLLFSRTLYDKERQGDEVTLMLESISATNLSLKELDLMDNDLTEKELFSLSRNLFKFSRLQRLDVDVGMVSNFEFLKPLLRSEYTPGKENLQQPPVPSSLKKIQFSNSGKKDFIITKKDDNILVQLLKENPKLTRVHVSFRPNPSPMVEHHEGMNRVWLQYMSTSESSLIPSLWPLVVASVESKKDYYDRDDFVPSIRYSMIQYLVSYGLFTKNAPMFSSKVEDTNAEVIQMEKPMLSPLPTGPKRKKRRTEVELLRS